MNFLRLAICALTLSGSVFAGETSQGRDDENTIKALVEQLQSPDFRQHRQAVKALSQNHGEFAAAYLTRYLGSNADPATRFAMISVLAEIGADAVSPVSACLNSDDVMTRRGAVVVLGRIGDLRSFAGIQRIAESDADNSNRAIATETIRQLTHNAEAPNAHDIYCEAGESFLRAKPSDSMQPKNVVWRYQQNVGVQRVDIAPALYFQEIARDCFANAIRMAPNSKRASSGLVAAYNSEIAALNSLKSDNAEAATASESFANMSQLGLIASGVSSNAGGEAAVAKSEENKGNPTEASSTENATPAKSSESLNKDLMSGDKPTRYAAAIALTKSWASNKNGNMAWRDVVPTLAAAVAEDTAKVVEIIDENTERRNRFAKQLTEAGYYASTADSAIEGLIHIKRYGAADLVLLSTTVGDLDTDITLKDILEDSRTEKIQVFLITDKKSVDKTKETYGAKAKQVLDGSMSLDLAMVSEAVIARDNPNRKMTEQFAREAAEALATIDSGSCDTSVAEDALVHAIQTRGDDTAIPAAKALANAGCLAKVDTMVKIFNDNKRSPALRAAIAEGFGGLFSRVDVAPSAAVQALAKAIQNESDAGIRQASAAAIGRAKALTPEDRVIVFTQALQVIPTQPVAKAENNGEEKKMD